MEKTATIINPLGLHARASAKFVRQLADYPNARVRVRCGSREVNGDSLMSLMTLSAKIGSEVTLIADGDGAEDALQALIKLINEGFGEI